MQRKVKDSLTHLQSEDVLEELMYYEIRRAERYKRPLSFLLMEPVIAEGDSVELIYPVLKKIAGFIRQHTRFVDISFRIGRQILMIMTETNYDCALIVKEKLSNLAQNETFRVSDEGLLVPVKLLTAIASYPESGATVKALLNKMEESLEEERQS